MNMRLRTKTAVTGILLTAPLTAGCLVFYVLPFGQVLAYSVTSGVGANRSFSGLGNYRALMDNGLFRLALGNTVRFLAVSLPLAVGLAYAAALMLRGESERHRALKSVLLFPYITPVVGAVLAVDLVFGETGLLNLLLDLLGLPVRDWLNSPAAFHAAVALYVWKNTGYAVVLLLSGLAAIPRDQYAAAELDGATPLRQFIHITVPQMWYSLFITVVFSLINAFRCFREILLIGGGHPDDSVYMLQHFINNCFENLSLPKLAVASVMLFAAVTALFAAMYVFVSRKERFRDGA